MAVSTINKVGADYPSFAAWESDKDGDLTVRAESETLEVYNDLGVISVDSDLCVLSGWTTSTTYDITITAPSAERNSSDPLRWGFGAAIKLENSPIAGVTYVGISIEDGAYHVTIEGLEIRSVNDQWLYRVLPIIQILYLASTANPTGVVNISHCIFTFESDVLRKVGNGVEVKVRTVNAAAVNVFNCVIYNTLSGIITTTLSAYNGGNLKIYNCTVAENRVSGIHINYMGYAGVWNDLSWNPDKSPARADFYTVFGFDGGSNNFSKDDSAPGANSIHGDTEGKDPDFVSVVFGSEDFDIGSLSDAIDAGLENPGSGLYDDDIHGLERV